MVSVAVKCRAKDPANCRFPGHQSLHVNEQSSGMENFFGSSLPGVAVKNKIHDSAAAGSVSAAGLSKQALNSSLKWSGVEPQWWKKFHDDSVSHSSLPCEPELLDVVDSPVGRLAVVWQPESQERNDIGPTMSSGMTENVCLYKSVDTGETLGFVKMTSMTKKSIERSFGDDEFTPFRWQERFSGSNYGFEGEEFDEPYGDRDLTGESLLQKRREVWVSAQQSLGNGVNDANGQYVPTYNITSSHVPDDETVEKDLKNFAVKIRKEIKNVSEYYRVPYVDFSRVEDPLKGKGFGTALYVYTSRKLAENNQVLRGSGIQSDDAVKAWDGFRKRFRNNVSEVSLNYKNSKSVAPVLDFRK